jgi:hypothetical protein
MPKFSDLIKNYFGKSCGDYAIVGPDGVSGNLKMLNK